MIINPKSHVMHIPAKDLSLLLCRIDRQAKETCLCDSKFLLLCECKAVILFRFSPESSQKRRRFLNQEEKCDFLITLTTLLGSCHSYHSPYSYNFSDFLDDIFFVQTSTDHGRPISEYSYKAHGVVKRSQKSPESPLFRLDPFSPNVLHTPKPNIGTWSEFVKQEGGQDVVWNFLTA